MSSKWWMKYFASSMLMHSDGCSLNTFAPAPPLPNNIHFSLSFSRISLHISFDAYFVYLSFTTSMPIISPAPRASPMTLLAAEILCSSFSK